MNKPELLAAKYGNVYSTYNSYDDYIRLHQNEYVDEDDDYVICSAWEEAGCTCVELYDNNHHDEIVVIREQCLPKIQQLFLTPEQIEQSNEYHDEIKKL